MDRKQFISGICLSGACACGLSSMALQSQGASLCSEVTPADSKIQLMQGWILSLLNSMYDKLDEETLRGTIKDCYKVHYDSLGMEKVLAEYIGDLDAFIGFLQEKWGWIIDYNREENWLVADENKDHCVCPLVGVGIEGFSKALCYCSEGFAERMFSTITGKPAKASIVSSVIRGDATCKYRVLLA